MIYRIRWNGRVRWVQTHRGATYDQTSNGYTVYGRAWNKSTDSFSGTDHVHMSDVEPRIVKRAGRD
jgi:hypothetical protein